MKLYDCKVRLHGEVKDEVRKNGVTAAEVKMLRAIHGEDAIEVYPPTGEVKRSDAAERDRLSMIYGEARVIKVFGVQSASLEDDIQVTEKADTVDPEEVEDEPIGQPDPETLPVVEQSKPADNLFE